MENIFENLDISVSSPGKRFLIEDGKVDSIYSFFEQISLPLKIDIFDFEKEERVAFMRAHLINIEEAERKGINIAIAGDEYSQDMAEVSAYMQELYKMDDKSIEWKDDTDYIYTDNLYAYIDTLYVMPEYRGKHLGSILINDFPKMVREFSAQTLRASFIIPCPQMYDKDAHQLDIAVPNEKEQKKMMRAFIENKGFVELEGENIFVKLYETLD